MNAFEPKLLRAQNNGHVRRMASSLVIPYEPGTTLSRTILLSTLAGSSHQGQKRMVNKMEWTECILLDLCKDNLLDVAQERSL